ncbi:unnamed protein product [Paramecium primaurelia]|uniref:Tectonic domain-containing protein n=1 Tax=Paramecium primaurelia TaxID=5886 RepID=A0A8S1N900_PARPR|nr:unnamed protein product [Paramecium primaurelia]
MYLIFASFIIYVYSQFTKTIQVPVVDENATNTVAENIQIRSTRIYSDPNRGACMCDLIINICDSQCCCDVRCSETFIEEWTILGICLNSNSETDYFYPECGDLVNKQNVFDDKYHFNQINDIMCSAVQRLPYAGVFANIEDTQTLTPDYKSFDIVSTGSILFTLVTNPQYINPTSLLPQGYYSGNPGYIKGKPLMVGKSNGDGFNLIWYKELRVYAWQTNGYCSTGAADYNNKLYKVINFGEDLVLSCSLEATVSLGTYCSSGINYEIMKSFKDNTGSFYYIGKWGSSSNNRTGEWIQINTTQIENVTSSCTLPIEQQLTIIYQKAGFVGDLQNTIISANVTNIPINYASYTGNSVQLTLRVKFIELIDSEIDPNTEKSLRDTIVPYVKKIFLPFTFSMNLFGFGMILVFLFL